MTEHSYILPTDCVYYKGTDGSMMSCGYKIDSELLKHGHQIMSVHGANSKRDSVSSLFKNLAVPMGLLCSDSDDAGSLNASTLDSDVIPKSLFDKLVELAEVKALEESILDETSSSRKQTRTNKSKKSSSKTRKQKK